MRDSRQEIADALAGSGRSDPETALRVLGSALRWTADTLGRPDHASVDGTPDADEADALRIVYALDEALAPAPDLAKVLLKLLEVARPGDTVARANLESMAALTAAAERVAEERAALEELTAREQELRRHLAEHQELRQEIVQLQRLEGLAAELEAVQAQREVFDSRLRELRARGLGTAEQELRTVADDLLRLTGEQLAVLEPLTRETLRRAAAEQKRLADGERELHEGSRLLAATQDRLERVRLEQDKVSESLTRWAQADQELARALREAAGTDTREVAPERGLTLAEVEALTRTVEQRLTDADEALSRVLAERQRLDEDGGTRITGAQS